jgi:hypothetical protein
MEQAVRRAASHHGEVPGALQAALLHAPREVMPLTDCVSIRLYMWRGSVPVVHSVIRLSVGGVRGCRN